MDVNSAAWRKSSYSGGNGGGCVEVAPAENDVAVRDSKDPGGPRLQFSADDWRAFLTRIKELPPAESFTARYRIGRCRVSFVSAAEPLAQQVAHKLTAGIKARAFGLS